MRKLGIIFLACTVCLGSVMAHDNTENSAVASSYLKQAKRVEGQFVSLAKAIPQSKYNWRPMKGVRSIAEAFMHVALGNYIMLQTLGGTPPATFDMKTYQTSTTDRDKIIAEMQNSFSALNDFIAKIPESEYGQTVKFFGMDATKLDIIFVAATHEHETLGQAIAYARVNHIVPPWTAAEEAREKGAKK